MAFRGQAEVVGDAIALQRLFGLPLVLGGLIVSVVSLALLAVQNRSSQRHFESVIMGLLGTITLGSIAGLFVSPVNWGKLLAAMPHAIYLHSSLSRDRHGSSGEDEGRVQRLLKANRWDVVIALFVAGCGRYRHDRGRTRGHSKRPRARSGNCVWSGTVGLQPGLNLRWVRRGITVVPALIILSTGVEPTWMLVLSQVVLSVGIPFALVPLVWLTGSKRVMGPFVDGKPLQVMTVVVTAAIIALNILLIYLTFTGQA